MQPYTLSFILVSYTLGSYILLLLLIITLEQQVSNWTATCQLTYGESTNKYTKTDKGTYEYYERKNFIKKRNKIQHLKKNVLVEIQK